MPASQQQINYGNTANDGQGDPLRTAFIKTDDNFDAVWNAGPVGSNVTILNNTVSVVGTNGNLGIAANGIGVIETRSSLVPRLANSYDLGSTNLRYRSAYIGSGGLDVTGNLTLAGSFSVPALVTNSISSDDSSAVVIEDALSVQGALETNSIYTDNYFYANGSPFAPGSSYGNANVANYLASGFGSFGANTIVTNGNIVASALDVANINHEFPIGIQTNGGGVWEFSGNILRGPQGGSWQSDADTAYFNSPANGFLNFSSLQNDNVVSELFMEHSFIRFFIDNGIDATWEMKADGRTEFPSFTFPYADGNAGEVLKTDGAGNLAWAADSSDYGNANVADYLVSDFGTFGSNTIVTAGNVVASVIDTGAIVNDFTIGIQGGEYLWQFAGNILRSPEGGTWQSASGTEYISSNATSGFINLVAYDAGNLATELFMEHGFVRIRVDNGGPEQDWNFRVTGVLDVPGDIIPQANATQSLGNSTNYWANLWVANNTIYIGGVPLGITGNTLTVNGESVLANDSDTAITTTGNITANYFIGDGSLLTGVASTGNITVTNTTMSPPDGVDITISAANSEVIIEAFDIRLDATDDLRLIGNDIVSLRNRSTTDPVTIITDYDDTETTWTFAVDGTLTTPGDIVVAGDVTGTAGANTLVLKAQPASNTLIQLNSIVDSVISTVANLEIRTDVSGTAQTWTFGTDGVLTAPGDVTTTGNITGNTAGFAIGYRDIPQVAFTGNVTMAAADAGKHYYSTQSANYILTIANNTSVGWSVGTAITVVNRGTGNMTIAQGSGVSLYLAGNNTAGNRTVTTYGMATVLNVAANVWMINGTGVS